LFKLHEGSSEEIVQRALEMCRRLGDRKGMAEALHELEYFYRDDFDTAKRLLDESAALARQAGDDMRLSWVLARSAENMSQHEPGRALDLLGEAVELARQRGDERTALSAQLEMTEPLIALDRADDARTNLDDRVADVLRVRDGELAINLTSYYAVVFAALGDHDRAGRLLGANYSLWESFDTPLDHAEEEAWLHESGVRRSRDRLGVARWEQAIQTGLGYTLEEALNDAKNFKPADASLDQGVQK
jgi:tetratricopeptide (TPR) repeat protein